jgi:molybdate transport system substrate-binding protein
MRRPVQVMVVLAAAVSLVLAGCSSNSGNTSGGGSSTPAAATSTPVQTSAASTRVQTSAASSSAPGGASDTADASDTGAGATGSATGSGPALSGTLTVFAAASLKKTFDQLKTTFQQQNPGVRVKDIDYDGSNTLVTQLKNGAGADVFASADEATMDKVADLITGRVDFVTNTLQIAVAPGNPKNITGLADLAKSGITTVICAPAVPCGAASQRALAKAGVDLKPASEEQNVTAVLTKVSSGDADAGLVYQTDVKGAGGKVAGVDFPEASAAVNTYPIAALKASKNPAAAAAFVALVTGPEGQQVFAAAGFGKP